jgi:anaerobic magnesium-protoporphyrin IX monomethyl ester cyclase
MAKRRSRLTCMLVRPPAGYASGNKPNIKEGLYLPPQALPLLAKVIQKAGAEPVVIDFEVNSWNLSDFMQTFGKVCPDIVLFTVTTPSYCYCHEIAAAIRAVSPDTPIVFGGPHATYDWIRILSDGVADIVVFREGEFALAGLLDALLHGRSLSTCKGIAYADSLASQLAVQRHFPC